MHTFLQNSLYTFLIIFLLNFNVNACDDVIVQENIVCSFFQPEILGLDAEASNFLQLQQDIQTEILPSLEPKLQKKWQNSIEGLTSDNPSRIKRALKDLARGLAVISDKPLEWNKIQDRLILMQEYTKNLLRRRIEKCIQ